MRISEFGISISDLRKFGFRNIEFEMGAIWNVNADFLFSGFLIRRKITKTIGWQKRPLLK